MDKLILAVSILMIAIVVVAVLIIGFMVHYILGVSLVLALMLFAGVIGVFYYIDNY